MDEDDFANNLQRLHGIPRNPQPEDQGEHQTWHISKIGHEHRIKKADRFEKLEELARVVKVWRTTNYPSDVRESLEADRRIDELLKELDIK